MSPICLLQRPGQFVHSIVKGKWIRLLFGVARTACRFDSTNDAFSFILGDLYILLLCGQFTRSWGVVSQFTNELMSEGQEVWREVIIEPTASEKKWSLFLLDFSFIFIFLNFSLLFF